MWRAFWAVVWAFIKRGLGLGGAPQPSDTQKVGTDEQKITDLEAANATDQTALRANAQSAADLVRDDPHSGEVDTDPKSDLNTDPDLHLRN